MAYVAAFDVDECCQCVMVWNEPISMLPKQLNTITTCHDLRMMERYQPIDYVGVGDVCLDVKFFVPLPHFPIFHVWPDCQAIFSSVLRHHAILCDSVSLFISCECVYACQRRCRQLDSSFLVSDVCFGSITITNGAHHSTPRRTFKRALSYGLCIYML